jgi:hypothetical protein
MFFLRTAGRLGPAGVCMWCCGVARAAAENVQQAPCRRLFDGR